MPLELPKLYSHPQFEDLYMYLAWGYLVSNFAFHRPQPHGMDSVWDSLGMYPGIQTSWPVDNIHIVALV